MFLDYDAPRETTIVVFSVGAPYEAGMKKLINDPRSVVREMLEGAVDLAPGQAPSARSTRVPQPP